MALRRAGPGPVVQRGAAPHWRCARGAIQVSCPSMKAAWFCGNLATAPQLASIAAVRSTRIAQQVADLDADVARAHVGEIERAAAFARELGAMQAVVADVLGQLDLGLRVADPVAAVGLRRRASASCGPSWSGAALPAQQQRRRGQHDRPDCPVHPHRRLLFVGPEAAGKRFEHRGAAPDRRCRAGCRPAPAGSA